jgi:CRISPR-associated endonuclease/helicase Cas3
LGSTAVLQRPVTEFAQAFETLTGNTPYPWQEKLYLKFLAADVPPDVNLPTGSGKTSIISIWLIALATQARTNPAALTVPRRIVWIVDRRVVVDQATNEAEQIRTRLNGDDARLAWMRDAISAMSMQRKDAERIGISTLRGEREDNREWSRDPSRPAIIIGTVDMIGSRLLFSGYGDGIYQRPQHAGLLGHDSLIINDEAHLTPALANLLCSIEKAQITKLKPFRTIRLSATHKDGKKTWPESLADDQKDARFARVFHAPKGLEIEALPSVKLDGRLIEVALSSTEPARVLIFVREPDKARKIAEALKKKLGSRDRVLTLTGTMRGYERDQMISHPVFKAFAGREKPAESCWIVATSAGEVGINISADILITDLDTLMPLLQRFGRLNRFGEGDGVAYLLVNEADEKSDDDKRKRIRAALKFLRELPRREDEKIDISPSALFGLSLPQDACTEEPLFARLHPWLLDVWSQTSLGACESRPDVSSWLHGKQDNIPQTFIAWRNDVPLLLKAEDSTERDEALKKYRLLAHEQLRERADRLIGELLPELVSAAPPGPVSALLRRIDGSVEEIELREFLKEAEGAFAQRQAFARIANCQLILPSGMGSLENGMFSPRWKTQEAAEQTDPPDVSAVKPVVRDGRFEVEERGATLKASKQEDGSWSLSPVAVHGEKTFKPLPNVTLPSLKGFAREQGWKLVARVPLETETEDVAGSVLLYFKAAKRAAAKNSDLYLLGAHRDHVLKLAEELAGKLVLPAPFTSALQTAAFHHDDGKHEQIWQNVAGGPGVDGPVAKSIKNMRGRELNGFRHELASIVNSHDEIVAGETSDEIRDLMLHLIAAHHGHARPCFQERAYNRKKILKSKEMALESARRFARLQRRFGPWGLAYLEAVLKAADGIASADWEDPTYA